MTKVSVAATQMSCSWDINDNIERASELVRKAASNGAQIILLQELFKTPYFCIEEDAKHYALAESFKDSQFVEHFRELAKDLEVVIPTSYYERSGNALFNSIAIVDADGEIKGHYRKSHIPHGYGYQEKFYFSPGDSGFKVTKTRYGTIGVGICWDQWFPECARSMALQGAELIFYPTAIGSEETRDSMAHWQRVMQGHAGANLVPVIASNRIGTEHAQNSDDKIKFYGSSFIADHLGEKIAEMDRETEGFITAEFDLKAVAYDRDEWGIFRDRRSDLYQTLTTMDGSR